MIDIEVPFLNGVRHITYQWNFPYSDDLFRESSGTFSIETARASMGLTVSAFRNNKELIEDQYETYLKAAEASSTNHFTVQQVIALLFNTILFLLVILLGSLGIFIVHAVKKKKTGQTYSPWFVIGPHMAIVYLLLVVSRFVSVNMFSIANAEIVNAALITGVIFLLALRGLLRNRCLINLIICIVFLVMTVVNFLLFRNNRFLTSSVWHFVIYCVLIVIAANLAAATFFIPNKKKQ